MACVHCPKSLLQSLNIFTDLNTTISFFQAHNVLPTNIVCATCAKPAHFDATRLRWRCQRTTLVDGIKTICKFTHSIRASTRLNKTHLSFQTIGQFYVYFLFLPPPHQEFLKDELHLGSATVIEWSKFIREIQLEWCLKNMLKLIGGPGTVIEVDEAKFGHRKYNRGRKVDGQWVVGGIQRGSTNIFLEVIPDRRQETLMEVIHRRVLPGTTIITDGWRSYGPLAQEGIHNAFKFIFIN